MCRTPVAVEHIARRLPSRGVVRRLIAERGDPEVDRVVGELRELHRAPARRILEHARLFAAEISLAQARQGELSAFVEVYRALGVGWQVEP